MFDREFRYGVSKTFHLKPVEALLLKRRINGFRFNDHGGAKPPLALTPFKEPRFEFMTPLGREVLGDPHTH